MTDQQINQAIAKACGWRKEDGVYMWTVNRIDCTCPELWDWCNDLNAMHDAESLLHRKKPEFASRCVVRTRVVCTCARHSPSTCRSLFADAGKMVGN